VEQESDPLSRGDLLRISADRSSNLAPDGGFGGRTGSSRLPTAGDERMGLGFYRSGRRPPPAKSESRHPEF